MASGRRSKRNSHAFALGRHKNVLSGGKREGTGGDGGAVGDTDRVRNGRDKYRIVPSRILSWARSI